MLQGLFLCILWQLLLEALMCNKPLIEYTYPSALSPKNPIPLCHPISSANHKLHLLIWNAYSLNTTMSCLQKLVTHSETPSTIIIIHETQLTTTVSIQHIQDLFPHSKVFLNNTHHKGHAPNKDLQRPPTWTTHTYSQQLCISM